MSADLFDGNPAATAPEPRCSLIYDHPSVLLAAEPDLRDRTLPEYREFFDRLVADLRLRGVQQPIVACREAGRLRTVDGETRRRGALLAGLERVPILAFDRPLAPAEADIAKFLANAMRLDMTQRECAAFYLRVMQEKGWGQAELARRLNLNPATVSKTLAVFSKLPAELQDRVGDGDGSLPMRGAYALTRLADPQQQRDLAEKVCAGLLKVEALEEQVAILLGGRKKRAERPVRARTGRGLLAVIPPLDHEAVLGELAALMEAVKKAQKHGLPLASVPQLLRAA